MMTTMDKVITTDDSDDNNHDYDHDGNSDDDDDDDDGDHKAMTTMSDHKCKENLKEYWALSLWNPGYPAFDWKNNNNNNRIALPLTSKSKAHGATSYCWSTPLSVMTLVQVMLIMTLTVLE